MKNFLVIYNAPAEAMEQMANISPEEQAKGMEPWMAWNAKFSDQIVDLGSPLATGQRLNPTGEWNGSTTEVSGYSIVKAETVEAAREIFVDHPHTSWAPGCTIDIHECMPI